MSFWPSRLLWHLRWMTVSGAVRNLLECGIACKRPDKDTRARLRRCRREFSDFWNYIGAFGAFLAWVLPVPTWFPWIGLWRAYEITINQANVLFTTDREMTLEKTIQPIPEPRRLLLVALFNYTEIVLWFAALYRIESYRFSFKPEILNLAERFTSLYYSIMTMVTLGYGDITPKTDGVWLVTIHLAVTIFLSLIVLARFVSILGTGLPEEKDGDV